jgi:hypothetical protein
MTGAFWMLFNAPAWALVLLFLACLLITLGIIIAWQNYHLLYRPTAPTARAVNSDAVAIRFDDVNGQRYYTWEIERENGQEVSVQRKSILLENHAGRDLENVTVKIERIIGENEPEPSSYLGHELHLEQNSTRIRRNDSAWVPLFSYRKDKTPAWFSIEGIDTEAMSKKGKIFRPHIKREVHLMVRADEGVETSALFLVQVNDAGVFDMKRLSSSSFNSVKAHVLPADFTSLQDAARKFYEAARAGKIPFGEASENLSGWAAGGPASGSPEDILHWWAVHVSKELSVYGMRPPSTILEEIPKRDVKGLVFAESATRLKDPVNDSVCYMGLCVRTEDLEEQYGFESGFHGSH